MIYVGGSFCYHVLLTVDISEVCFVFRISSMVILVAFKTNFVIHDV